MEFKDTNPGNPKDVMGSQKAPVEYLPWPAVFEAGLVALSGAVKYRAKNWRVYGVRSSVYVNAAFRHIAAWLEGEDDDPESGVSHLSHAVCGLMILRDAQMEGKMIDDRAPRSERAANWLRTANAMAAQILERSKDPKPPHTREEEESITAKGSWVSAPGGAL